MAPDSACLKQQYNQKHPLDLCILSHPPLIKLMSYLLCAVHVRDCLKTNLQIHCISPIQIFPSTVVSKMYFDFLNSILCFVIVLKSSKVSSLLFNQIITFKKQGIYVLWFLIILAGPPNFLIMAYTENNRICTAYLS